MLLIGIGFRARNGKDTVAAEIIKARGGQYDIRKYAFADELKKEYTQAIEFTMVQHNLSAQDAVAHLCHWADKLCVQNGYKDAVGQPLRISYDPAPDMADPLCPYGKQRLLLQFWGTEYRRFQNPFYWIGRLQATVDKERPQVALVTDLRFPNEYWFIRNRMDGVTVKVERYGFDNGLTHPSESKLDGYKFDYEIVCPDNSLEELKKDAVVLFDTIVADSVPGPTAEELNSWAHTVLLSTEEVNG
jgi:hypothetical protein